MTDLAVLRNGENVLLRGLGGCRFARANETWSFDGGNVWTSAFSAKWEGSAALPTLAIGNYVADASGAYGYACQDNAACPAGRIGRDLCAGVTLSPSWCPLSMLFSDWDRSGRVDLRVSNDRQYYPSDEGQEQLWRVAPGEAPRSYTSARGLAATPAQRHGHRQLRRHRRRLSGGLPHQPGSQHAPDAGGRGDPTELPDIAIERGVDATYPTGDKSLPSTSWHDEFADVNNDGRIDLFVAKGNVAAMQDYALKDPNDLFLGQPDGTFIDEAKAAGVYSVASGRGAAVVDLNLDGLLDLVVSNRVANAELWRNVGAGSSKHPQPMGDWLALQLNQPGPNHDAIGAWVEVKVGDQTLTREVTVGGGQAGGQLGWIHFGLGSTDTATSPQVRVQWPDQEWGSVAAGGRQHLRHHRPGHEQRAAMVAAGLNSFAQWS